MHACVCGAPGGADADLATRREERVAMHELTRVRCGDEDETRRDDGLGEE